MTTRTQIHATTRKNYSSNQSHRSILRSRSLFAHALFFMLMLLPWAIYAQNVSVLREALPMQLQSSLPPGVAFPQGTPLLRTAEHSGGNLILAPSLEGISTIENLINSAPNDSNLIIEALVFLPAPTGSPSLFDTRSALQKFALIFNKFSSLQGIQYWSGSRKIMRTLYISAYRVVSAKNQQQIQDPSTIDDLLASLSKPAYIYQKDQTFDGIVTEVQSVLTASTFLMTNINVTPLRLIGIPVLAQGGLKTGFLVAPYPQGTLLYFVTSIKPPLVGKDRVFESSTNKALALLHWFITAASAENLISAVTIPWNIDEIPSDIRLVTKRQ